MATNAPQHCSMEQPKTLPPLFLSAPYSGTLPHEGAMTAHATGRAPMMNLRELVDRYEALAGSFGNPVALSAFGLTLAETQNLFSAFDEDYHISRFLHFSRSQGKTYVVSQEPVTHLAIDPAIHSIL